jgi:hypothetical protein
MKQKVALFFEIFWLQIEHQTQTYKKKLQGTTSDVIEFFKRIIF